MDGLLEVRQLKTHFHTVDGIVKAVDGVSLTVDKNEIVGIVGESGCGKTMTALSIVRLIPPPGRIVGGDIVFEGKSLLNISDDEMREIRGKGISMVFQDPMTFLNPVMKVKDQIAEVIVRHSKITRAEANVEAVNMLEKVRMPAPRQIADYYPHQLSGGMRQRVLISIGLACKPKLVIADEPTTALDPTVQQQIVQLMRDLMSSLDTSLLIITHDVALSAEICNRIYIMYAGKIVEGAGVEAIFQNPMHPYTRLLLECVPRPDQKSTIRFIAGTVPDLSNPPSGCRFQPRCPRFLEKCAKEEPPLKENNDGHIVACWLW